MATTSEDLRREALALSDSERADLAAELLLSLEQHESSQRDPVASAWATEIERRARDVLAGGDRGETWDVVRARLADSLNR